MHFEGSELTFKLCELYIKKLMVLPEKASADSVGHTIVGMLARLATWPCEVVPDWWTPITEAPIGA